MPKPIMHLSNYLYVLASMEKEVANPYLRNFAYFEGMLFEQGIDIQSNMMGDEQAHPMAYKRGFTLLNAAFMYLIIIEQVVEGSISLIDSEKAKTCLKEVTSFIFNDPDANTSKLKNPIGVCFHYAFCTSKGFEIPDFTGCDLTSHEITNMNLGYAYESDEAIYEAFKDNLDKSLVELEEMGCSQCSITMRELMHRGMDRSSVHLLQMFPMFLSISGYTRAMPYAGVSDTVKRDELFDPKPFANAVYREVQSLYSTISAADFGDEKKFKRDAYSNLNSKSSGTRITDNLKKIVYYVQTDRPIGRGTVRYKGKLYVKIVNGSKSGVFMANSMVDYFDIVKNRLSKEEPGRVGTRHVVGGRRGRTIFNIPTTHFTLMSYFVNPAYKKIHTPDDDGPTTGFPGVVPEPLGNLVYDNRQMLISTTIRGNVIMCKDFDEFDRTIPQSVLEAAGLAIKDRLQMLDIWDSVFMDHKVSDYWDYVFSPGTSRDAYFATGHPDRPVLKIPGLYSGVFWTSIVGSICNIGIFRLVIEEMVRKNLIEQSDTTCLKVLGDDFIHVFRREYNAGNYKDMIETNLTVGKRCGVQIAVNKSVAGSHRASFLKVAVIWGQIMHWMQVELMESEREISSDNFVDFLISFGPKLTTMVTRGVPYRLAQCIMYVVSVVKGHITDYDFKKDIKTQIFVPFVSLFVPISSGGPCINILGGTYDMMNTVNYKNRHLIEPNTIIYQGLRKSDPTEIISGAIKRAYLRPNDGHILNENMESKYVFKPGVDFINSTLLQERKKNSAIANKYLMGLNIKLPAIYSYNMLALRRAIAGNVSAGRTKLRLYAQSSFNKIAMRNILRYEKNERIEFSPYKFLKYMSVDISEIKGYDVEYITPFTGSADLVLKLVKRWGMWRNTGSNSPAFFSRIMNRLYHGGMPPDIRPEFLLKYINMPGIIGSLETLKHFFHYFGVDETVATTVAVSIYQNGSGFFGTNKDGISSGDEPTRILDASPGNVKRFVTVNSPLPLDKFLESFLNHLGMILSVQFSVENYIPGRDLKSYLVTFTIKTEEAHEAIMNAVFGTDFLYEDLGYGDQ